MAVESIKNHDIMGLVRRINRVIVEIANSQSAGTSGLREADLIRLKSYQAALKEYKAWVVGQPELDLPETHPTEHAVPAMPDISTFESESLTDIVTMLGNQRDELLASQSAELATGLTTHDSTRFDMIHAKVDAFIEAYIETTIPLDLPESSPGSG